MTTLRWILLASLALAGRADAQPKLPPPPSVGKSIPLGPEPGQPGPAIEKPSAPAAEKPANGPTARLLNAGEVRGKLGLGVSANTSANLAKVKIAVLDFGFEGCDPKKLAFPAGSTLVEHYPADWVRANNLGDPEFLKGFEPGNPHGRLMAQAAWAVAGNSPQGPVFLLLNANGPTLFRRAVRHAIEQGVQVILFSAHFEGGGNFDGHGTINAMADEAIRAGIIWVNAAGNHHGRVYNGPITPGPDGFLRFGPSKKTALTFTNRLDENTHTITLTWNDYAEREDAGTAKDLSLIVETAAGKEIGRADLKQIAGDKPAGDGESRNPRERLILPSLGAGTYRIRVESKGSSFTAKDRVRILINPTRGEPYPHPDTGKPTDPLVFADASNSEELYPPADNPRVITVGEIADYSATGPTADRRLKPDLLLPSLPAKWSNGEVAGGTSYTAAFFAGMIASWKADYPKLQTNDVMDWIAMLRKPLRLASPKPAPVPWRSPTAKELAALLASRK